METISTDLFFYLIPYLDFDDVVPFCSINKKFQKYGTQYPDRWKILIDHTYSFVYGYSVQKYDYLTYGYFIREVDLVSKLMIHIRRGNDKFAKTGDSKLRAPDRIMPLSLAYYLLRKDPSVPLRSLSESAKQFAKYGNMTGLLEMLAMIDPQAKIIPESDVLTYAKEGYFDVLHYTFDPTNHWNVQTLEIACLYGRLRIVKFLVEQKVLISEAAFVNACIKNHLQTVIYLSQMFPDKCEGFRTACAAGSLPIVKYLLPTVSEISIKEGFMAACNFGHIVILDFLKEYIDVPTIKDEITPILRVFPAESINHIITYLDSFE